MPNPFEDALENQKREAEQASQKVQSEKEELEKSIAYIDALVRKTLQLLKETFPYYANDEITYSRELSTTLGRKLTVVGTQLKWTLGEAEVSYFFFTGHPQVSHNRFEVKNFQPPKSRYDGTTLYCQADEKSLVNTLVAALPSGHLRR